MNKIKSRHIWILVVLLMVLFEGGYAEFLFLVKEGKEEMSNLVK